jgi:serine/threonine-protein kinase PknG
MEVLGSVPRLSSHHVTAQIALIVTAVRGRSPAVLTAAELTSAAARLDRLRLDAGRRRELIVQILEAALACVLTGHGPRPASVLLGAPLTEDAVRRSLEHAYRELARHADSAADKHALVVRANAVRPRTWI